MALAGQVSCSVGYLVSLIAIHLWPIGLAVVLTGTINLLNAQGGFTFIQNIPLLNSAPEAVKTLIAAGYTIVAVIAAPFITQKAVTSGGQIGTQALSTMFGLGSSAASAGSRALTTAAATRAAGAVTAQQGSQSSALLSKLDQIVAALGGGGSGLGTPNTPASNPPSSSTSGPSVSTGGSASAGPGRPAPTSAGAAASSSPVGSGWAATAGGSILTPPSYSQARAQTGDMSGSKAAQQMLSRSAISKPVMT